MIQKTLTSIVVTAGDNQSCPVGPFPTPYAQGLTARVTDQYGQGVIGVVVRFTPSNAGAGGSFSSTVSGAFVNATTDQFGNATTPIFYSNGTAGTWVGDIRTTGAEVIVTSWTATNGVVPPAPTVITNIILVSGGNQVVTPDSLYGNPLVFQCLNSNGVGVNQQPARVDPVGSTPQGWRFYYTGLNYWTGITDGDGYIRLQMAAGSGLGDVVLECKPYSGFTPATQATVFVRAAPESIGIVSGDNQQAALNTLFTLPLKVMVLDGAGQPCIGFSVVWTLPPTSRAGGTFPGAVTTATTYTEGAGGTPGLATSPPITSNGFSGYWYTEARVGPSPGHVVSFQLNNLTPQTITEINLIVGSGQAAEVGTNYTTNIQVVVTDQNDQPIPNVSVTFENPAAAPTGRWAGSLTYVGTTNSGGTVTAPVLTATGLSGTWVGHARATSKPSVEVAYSMQNTPAAVVPAPATLTLLSGGNQLAFEGQQFTNPVTVKVLDQQGRAFPNGTVTFSIPTGFAHFPAGQTANALTDANGVAVSPLFTGGTSHGVWNMTCTCAPATPLVVPERTADQTAAVQLQYISGGGQNTAINTPFAAPLVVRALNAKGEPIDGVVVTFTAPASGPSCTFNGSITEDKITGG